MLSKRGRKAQQPRLIGRGWDAKDGQKRITVAEGFVITGGSKETHEKMQEEGCKMSEEAARRGKTIQTLTDREVGEVMDKVLLRRG